MKNLKYAKTKIVPSKTRGGKELPSHSALDSPSVLSRLAKLTLAIHSDVSQVIDDATFAINETCDDASTLLDKIVPLVNCLMNNLLKLKNLRMLKLMKTLINLLFQDPLELSPHI